MSGSPQISVQKLAFAENLIIFQVVLWVNVDSVWKLAPAWDLPEISTLKPVVYKKISTKLFYDIAEKVKHRLNNQLMQTCIWNIESITKRIQITINGYIYVIQIEPFISNITNPCSFLFILTGNENIE